MADDGTERRRHFYIGKRVDVMSLSAIGGLLLTVIFWGTSLEERVAILEAKQQSVADRIDRLERNLENEMEQINARFDRLERLLFAIQDGIGVRPSMLTAQEARELQDEEDDR